MKDAITPERFAVFHMHEDHELVRVSGADAASYLHRMLTQDVEGMPVGGVASACLLNPKGRTLGAFRLWRFADHLWLDGSQASMKSALPVLERYVIADDVTFTPLHEGWALTEFVVMGTKFREVMKDFTRTPLERAEPWSPMAQVAVAEGWATKCLAERAEHGLRGERWFFWLQGANGRALSEHLKDTLVNEYRDGLYPLLRIGFGDPVYGKELGEHSLFNEAYFEEAVSWTKGCYPGQEPVVMARHRGKPPRRLVRLTLDRESDWFEGQALSVEGKPSGQLTSVGLNFQKRPGALYEALALVRHGLGVVGQRFEGEHGGTAEVTWVRGEETTPSTSDDNPTDAPGASS